MMATVLPRCGIIGEEQAELEPDPRADDGRYWLLPDPQSP